MRRRGSWLLWIALAVGCPGTAAAQPDAWSPPDALIVVDPVDDDDFSSRVQLLLQAMVAAAGPGHPVTLARSVMQTEAWGETGLANMFVCNDRMTIADLRGRERPDCGPFDNSRAGVLALVPRVSLALDPEGIDAARFAPEGDIHRLMSIGHEMRALYFTPQLFVLASLPDGGERGTQVLPPELERSETPLLDTHLVVIDRTVEAEEDLLGRRLDPAEGLTEDPFVEAFASFDVIDLRRSPVEQLHAFCVAVDHIGGECGTLSAAGPALEVDRLHAGDRLLAWTPEGPTTVDGLTATPLGTAGEQRLTSAVVPADCTEQCEARINAVHGPVHAVLLPAHFSRLSMQLEPENDSEDVETVIQLTATEGAPFEPLDRGDYRLRVFLDGAELEWSREGTDRVRVEPEQLPAGTHTFRAVLTADRVEHTEELEHEIQIPFELGTLTAGGDERCVAVTGPVAQLSPHRSGPVILRVEPALGGDRVCMRMPILETRGGDLEELIEPLDAGPETSPYVIHGTLVPRLWIPLLPLGLGLLLFWLFLVARDRIRRFEPRATHVAWRRESRGGFRDRSGAVWVVRPVAAVAADRGRDDPDPTLRDTSFRLQVEGPGVRVLTDEPVVHVPRVGKPHLATGARVLAGDAVVEGDHTFFLLDRESAERVSAGELDPDAPDESVIETTRQTLIYLYGHSEPSLSRVRAVLALTVVGTGATAVFASVAAYGTVPELQTAGAFVLTLLGAVSLSSLMFSRLRYPEPVWVKRHRRERDGRGRGREGR